MNYPKPIGIASIDHIQLLCHKRGTPEDLKIIEEIQRTCSPDLHFDIDTIKALWNNNPNLVMLGLKFNRGNKNRSWIKRILKLK